MYNRRYDKAFMFLKQETAGFSANERPIRGSCSLEIKRGVGKLSLFAQDLHTPRAGAKYLFIAVSARQNVAEGVKLADVSDVSGKVDIKIGFEPDNFFNAGRPVEDFNVFAVICQYSDKKYFDVLLCGYTENKINWKNQLKFVDEIEKKSQNIIIDKERDNLAEENDGEKPTEKKDNPKEAAKEQKFAENDITAAERASFCDVYDKSASAKAASDELKKISDKFKRELDELENAGVLSAEEIDEILNAQKNAKASATNEKQRLDFSDTLYAMEGGERIYPFQSDDAKWYATDISAAAVLPYESCRFMKTPFVACGYRKYGHIILGRNAKGEYFFGVPHKYDGDDELIASRLGFESFKRVNGEYGYWLQKIM